MDGIRNPQFDSLLLPYLRTRDESEADDLLQNLVLNDVVPAIKTVVRSTLRRWDVSGSTRRSCEWQDFEDIESETLVRVLDGAQKLRSATDPPPIVDFIGYVKVAARHTCDTYLRLNTRTARSSREHCNIC